MKARLQKALVALREAFWLLPGAMTIGGVLLAVALVQVDEVGSLSAWLKGSSWIYYGGAKGARTLLGAVASSTIGVAGTVFSITIAALSLAANQMGPRLLRNFTRDRGNQFTLGTFLGTFAYALTVLRAVRSPEEGGFVPHLSLSIGIMLALLCVGALVYFVDHMAGRINVDTVIGLVSEDIRAALEASTMRLPQPEPPPAVFWREATTLIDPRWGYLQQFDNQGLARWCVRNGVALRLLVRPGDYLFPGAPIALAIGNAEGAEAVIRKATALGRVRDESPDMEFAVRQLVEVAVRALSPSINDPHTAMSVVNRLGDALCRLAPLHLPTGVSQCDGKPVLVIPSIDYDQLLDLMFDMIRQNGSHSPSLLAHMLSVLTIVSSCEHRDNRVAALRRHADLVLATASNAIAMAEDLDAIRKRHGAFEAMAEHGVTGCLERLETRKSK
ncbi:DUF2254 domain-containing protein [Methylosinus sp. KRF6]|uniref:DUF2254 domain-containing protein n=1 Tax=Methylosinus sp. KRF6 TaxID=2846853 RepID=UPI001C0E7D68|nr:DUF2254 domain-containing protein [Methylosinus sp. KRF6]MBU3887874.1 DUF2254 domain-containing protein [Methylosinus sp. KRF6]